MNWSEISNLICAVLSLVVATIIGSLQLRQNRRMNKISQKQCDLESKQHAEYIDIETRKFLSEHYDTIGLLPLCSIAVVYNKDRPYHRKMYSDFRLLPKDVRENIFERCGWKMCDIETDVFFSTCLNKLDIAIKKFLPKDNFSMFYDHGKYIENAIKYYGQSTFPHVKFEYEDLLSRIVSGPFNGKIYNKGVIDIIIDRFSFRSCSGIEASQIACLTAKYIAIFAGRKLIDSHGNDSIDYGSPGDWSNEKIETMEDLFLLTLFEIWSNLWNIESEGKQNEENKV